MIGIYLMKNTKDNKVYVGKSTNINKRIANHLKSLKRNEHYNKHLQGAWNKDSEHFIFSILEECTIENINEREIYWISFYQSNKMQYGYNKTDGGSGTIGHELTKEHKQKLREANKGQVPWIKGKKHKQETIEKIKEKNKLAHLGVTPSNKIPVTQEMLDDFKSGMQKKEFVAKYKSRKVWDRIRKGNIENYKKS